MDETTRRRSTPARVYRLGDEPRDNLSSTTTADERLEMVALLSRRMWELTGQAFVRHDRATLPVRVIRRS